MRSEHEDGFSPSDTDRPAGAADASAADTPRNQATVSAGKPAVVDEVLIEEVSIDGMCGVY